MTATCLWRGEFSNEAVNRLHAEAFEHRLFQDDWWGQVSRHSLGWVCAHIGGKLVGFVNVAWDGALHAFVLDTLVAKECRGQGIASQMLTLCVEESRAAGCEWLHVDFEEHLRGLYSRAGFAPINAGAINLKSASR